ncbi:Aldehyde Dehydrogenase [Fusarium austroafricanum]|uniref:Aldehyde dehydrogenase n=1 Tax=Fusarium austroafricanum TaxID=2364996 RepID=A0A8H4KIT9_9HYPO|nr:Aldehyde Dehydrogenase [Fusarium austroafricanum]
MADRVSEEKFEAVYKQLRSTFSSGKTKDLKWRKWQLKQLFWLLDENESAFIDALAKDLNRSAFESLMADINEAKKAVLEALDHLEEWARDVVPPEAGFIYGTLGKARIRKEPLGLVLVIGAWNFPVSTLFDVAIAAIAAGNAVIMKPSEMAPETEGLLASLVPKYMDTSAISVVCAKPAQMDFILDHKFDFIFYTGSTRVGRIIASAAAKYVTPTALELGGQAPAIVTKTADINITAKRLVNAKLQNLGQICVCVNHVFVDPSIHDELVARMVYWLKQMLDSGNKTLARIVSDKHFDRLDKVIQATNGHITYTGEHARAERFIHPTIVEGVTMSDSLLSEELFGPVLPVIKADANSAIQIIQSMPHPLALYIFSESQKEINDILDSTQSGGVTINDISIHADVPSAPFGGVGDSGYGSYHGKWGFDTFSHNRTVVTLPGWIDRFTEWRYPPFNIANRSEVDAGKPKFRKGETLDDQRVGKTWLASIPLLGYLFR